ncbi:DNA-binding transcriptional LysR family regulator [Bosea sp. BE125]|uniref:LysR family transcriptional regulator n=1 Tax=Bosea sp. BE125 TaxID=2817909 RepID=UPI002858B8DE|nr:LysR family transcriptional regulator [Bosea sp. BE125]MDR6873213.1 DNA-binding transcriptional LysR family regulator [Bosea sp. BE125]
METRFLQTFLSVVQTGSLSEAARRLNITPSAVIQRIKALEDEIGRPLIQRSGHTMQPTPAGAAILAEVERMLAVADDIKAAAAADLETGLLRIGVINSALTGLLPDLLVQLRQNRPGIELYILPGMSGDLYSCITDGELDAAIMVQPHFALPKALDWLLLRQEELLVITPLSVTETDTCAILKRQPFIRYDRNHWGGRIVDLHLRKLKIRPREQYELDSLEAITVLVSRGLGVSLVPDWLPPWPEGANVRRIRASGAPTRDVGILWSRSSKRLPLIRAFMAEAVNAIRLKHSPGIRSA